MIAHYPVKFIANGIDRVDSLKSYTVNTMKNDSSIEKFKDQIRRVYNHLCLFS